MNAETPRRRGAFRFAWLWALAATLLLAAVERFVRPAIAERVAVTGRAEWIWETGGAEGGWSGFFAVRDFDLESVPEGRVMLVLTADEEYVAYLNGEVVGLGRFQPGVPIDAYDVSDLLLEGHNRLLIELRTSRGVGGLLLRLSQGDRTLVVSDGAWSTVGEYRERLKWPGEALENARGVRVWGRPPTGRWGLPEAALERPLLTRQLLSRRPLPAASARRADDEAWHFLPAEANRSDPIGNWVTFDFGYRVTGYLNLIPAQRGGARGLLWFSEEEVPKPRETPATGHFLALVGQGSWTDAAPRRFRYVTVVSLAPIAGGQAFVLNPELAAEMTVVAAPQAGILGLEPPSSGSAIEDEFWSEFESLTN